MNQSALHLACKKNDINIEIIQLLIRSCGKEIFFGKDKVGSEKNSIRFFILFFLRTALYLYFTQLVRKIMMLAKYY